MEEWSLLMERGWSLDHGQLSMPGLTKFCFKCVTQISTCFDFIFYWLKIHCLGAGTVTMWKVELMATSKSAFKSKVVLGYLITVKLWNLSLQSQTWWLVKVMVISWEADFNMLKAVSRRFLSAGYKIFYTYKIFKINQDIHSLIRCASSTCRK